MIIGTYIGIGNSQQGEEAYSDQYQAVLDKGTALEASLPSSSRKSVENNALQIILDQAGLWDKFLLFRVYQTDGDAAYARINWKTPNSYYALENNSPAFTTSQGYRSNGTTSYLSEVITFNDINQQSVCYFVKGLDNAQAANSFLFGGANAGTSGDSVFINPRNGSDQISYRVSSSSATVTVGSITDARNRICIGRDSGNIFHSINGAAKVSTANTFGSVDVTRHLYSLAYESNTGAAGFNTRGTAYLAITNSVLSDAEIAIVDSALDALTA